MQIRCKCADQRNWLPFPRGKQKLKGDGWKGGKRVKIGRRVADDGGGRGKRKEEVGGWKMRRMEGEERGGEGGCWKEEREG